MPRSRLSETETIDRTPSIYMLHALSVIYRCDITRLLAIYGLK